MYLTKHFNSPWVIQNVLGHFPHTKTPLTRETPVPRGYIGIDIKIPVGDNKIEGDVMVESTALRKPEAVSPALAIDAAVVSSV